ncbi:hypothetical protein Agabi119p4_9842 [Agaricus bisporus var. burnettii]|uniref:Uncharacterized protein n=1 Tax=Agaricus bisporus var. burnettii TaxID=192524 RepID=A0A8H7C4I9_AGABI|nr:hypothetical protein Agabi119p4_9842 [Agaricus bisporus var. burnettii]
MATPRSQQHFHSTNVVQLLNFQPKNHSHTQTILKLNVLYLRLSASSSWELEIFDEVTSRKLIDYRGRQSRLVPPFTGSIYCPEGKTKFKHQ